MIMATFAGKKVAKREPGLGIDIGKVIINGPAHPGGGDTAFFSGDEETCWPRRMDGAARSAIASTINKPLTARK
jgi:hypothetical protein